MELPPLHAITSPVIQLEALLNRNMTVSATSSDRKALLHLLMYLKLPSGFIAYISETVGPGATAFTLIRRSIYSLANPAVKCINAAFVNA